MGHLSNPPDPISDKALSMCLDFVYQLKDSVYSVKLLSVYCQVLSVHYKILSLQCKSGIQFRQRYTHKKHCENRKTLPREHLICC